MATFNTFDPKDEIEKVKKAFGGCEKCYGKGYSTQIDPLHSDTTRINTCVCDRGKQIDAMLETVRRGLLNTFVKELKGNLPEYIDEKFPKGKSKERGAAAVYITEFLLEVAKAIK